MKNLTKLVNIFFPIAAIVIIVSACSLEANKEIRGDGPTHISGTLTMSNLQVWEQNKTAVKLSDAYFPFTNGTEIQVYSLIFLPDSGNYVPQFLDEGKIRNGKLSIAVPELEDPLLMDWDDLNPLCFPEWSVIDPPSIEPSNTKGNMVYFGSPEGMLNREGLVGTPYSIGMESIIFFYVNKDCKITLGSGDGIYDGNQISVYDQQPLYLKEGWNTICKRESFGKSGNSIIAMTIKNPNDFKWVIYKNMPLSP